MLGVLGNFDERLPTVLDNLGILTYFDFILTSREVSTSLHRQLHSGQSAQAHTLHALKHANSDLKWDICHSVGHRLVQSSQGVVYLKQL